MRGGELMHVDLIAAYTRGVKRAVRAYAADMRVQAGLCAAGCGRVQELERRTCKPCRAAIRALRAQQGLSGVLGQSERARRSTGRISERGSDQ